MTREVAREAALEPLACTLPATTYDAFDNVTASTGTWRGPFGYQEDQTGLRLLGRRSNDSSTGRFLTRDPIKDGRNWYAYGAGESAPTGMVDPDGLHRNQLDAAPAILYAKYRKDSNGEYQFEKWGITHHVQNP